MNEKRIEELLTNDSFCRWIEGMASPIEVSKWDEWLQSDPTRKKLAEEAKAVHTSIRFRPDHVSESELESEFSRLRRSIDAVESTAGDRDNISMELVNRRRGHFMHVAVAVILLLTVLTVPHLMYPDTEVQEKVETVLLTTETEYSQKKIMTLSDGSTITLNANSSLMYPKEHSGGNFEVWLKGEAYFEIPQKSAPDRNKFTVHTSDGSVTVLGTKFNVNTYRPGTEVFLEEGRIQVELRDTLGQFQAAHTMEPGELSRFVNGRNSIEVSKVKTDVYTSWTQNKLIFDRTPLIEIIERIEQTDGVRLPITDPELLQTRVSGSVPSDNLPVLLKALGKMLERSISDENGIIHLDSAQI